jgi:cytochrome c5
MKKLIIAAAIMAASVAVQARDAAELYAKTCTICHETGAANAPKRGDAAAWKPRLEKGEEALMASIHNGLNAMPPKGMCFDCTDEEFKALLDYMSK